MKMMLNELMIMADIYQPAASETARDVDNVQNFINGLSIAFFVAIVVLMALFCVLYSRKGKDVKTPHISHNLTLEIAWSVIPLILLMVIFVKGYTSYRTTKTVPVAGMKDMETIYITGKMYDWTATYRNGGEINSEASKAPNKEIERKGKKLITFSTEKNAILKDPEQVTNFDKPAKEILPRIVLPAGRPVRLVITSNDILHSFFIPALRVKQDAIPGQTRSLYVYPDKPGTYLFQCAENCGGKHAFMIGYLQVLAEDDYNKYMDKIKPSEDPWELGKSLYESQCKACHSLDEGVAIVGPSWYKLWDSTRELAVGGTSAKVDFDYVKESLLDPNAKKAKGFENRIMGAIPLSDLQIRAITTFMASPNENPNNKKASE